MKQVLSITLIAGIIATLFSCKSSKETTAASPSESISMTAEMQNGPSMLASIERTACYGRCPRYKATFMDNGEVIYVGKGFVEKVGTYTSLISAEQVLDIEKKIVEYGYYELDSLYPTPITDFPSCITEVKLNGELKRVIDRRSPPENLKAFELFLDSLLKGKEFEKVSDDTDYDNQK